MNRLWQQIKSEWHMVFFSIFRETIYFVPGPTLRSGKEIEKLWERQFIACEKNQNLAFKVVFRCFLFQRLINMHIYDNQLYAKVEDLNV